jgi:DNA-binding MarR family transcriptional regulator
MPTAKKRTSKPAAVPASAVDAFDFQSDSLGYALRLAQVRAYELFYEMLSTLDLTPARLTALSMIAMAPGLNQATLAQRLRISGPSVLKLVDALQASGFIAREDCADDRRRYVLMLTAQGRAKLADVRQALDAYETRLAGALSAAERGQLMQLLGKVGSERP